LLEDSNFTYTYDENGNLTSKTSKANGEVTTYTYDGENQLIRVERPGVIAEYRYDALGRRIEKVVNGVSTRYLYHNEDIVVELDATGTVQGMYLHGPGIDEPLGIFRGREGVAFTYHADGLGSITHVTTSTGTLARSYTYDSFGRLVTQTGTLTNPYTYTGRELDPESGLYYYRTRYYDPASGRFLHEDPIGFLGGVDHYSYVLNNPVNLIDPEGLLFWGRLNAGEGYGESALQWYADILADPCTSGLTWAGALAGGFFSALWTPHTSDKTFWTLLTSGGVGTWLGRPFWRYVGPHSSEAVTWLTRGWGWKPPFGRNFVEAANKLHLWEYGGVPTDLIKVPYRMLKPIAGPRLVRAWGKLTGAVEYYYGRLLFP
jgi:RHS repeat-associated protein